MPSKKVLKKTDSMVTREIEGETILLPLSSSSKAVKYLYTLNETAAAFWKRINGKKDIDAIKNEILDIYDVDNKTLTKQVNDLIRDLRSIKAIN